MRIYLLSVEKIRVCMPHKEDRDGCLELVSYETEILGDSAKSS